jgi:hypothetical protein
MMQLMIPEAVPMSEKKIVIKLKYGASASQDHGSPSLALPPQYDWNYKRIALLVGVVAIALLGYRFLIRPAGPELDVLSESIISDKQPKVTDFHPPTRKPVPIQPGRNLNPDELQSLTDSELPTSVTDNTRQGEIDVADTAAFQKAANIDETTSVHTKNIVRARFTWGIKDREPTGEIKSPAILQPGDSVTLHFFSEFNDMKGQSISHEWSHNGNVVVAKDFQISENRSRVFSSKQLTSNLLGKWKVAIKDSKGENLGEFVLKVLAPKKSET